MKLFGESYRLYLMLLVSLAFNLFLLPEMSRSWFSSSRAERIILEKLHPVAVARINVEPKKISPLQPKLIPKPRPSELKPKFLLRKPLLPTPRRKHQASPRKLTQNSPRPHILTDEGVGEGPSVTQGAGQAGIPTLPSSEPSAPPLPPPPPPVKPKGETREAIAIVQSIPKIPESLRTQALKTFVRARFDIAPDGTAEVTLLISSGSPELDQFTLQTLRKWRWKPALKDSVPVSSSQRLRVEFEVE